MLLLVMTFRKLLERVLKLAIIIIREAKYYHGTVGGNNLEKVCKFV